MYLSINHTVLLGEAYILPRDSNQEEKQGDKLTNIMNQMEIKLLIKRIIKNATPPQKIFAHNLDEITSLKDTEYLKLKK